MGKTFNEASADRIGDEYKYNWDGIGCFVQSGSGRPRLGKNDLGSQGDQLLSKRLRARSGGRIAVVDMKVLTFGPTKSSQFLLERLQVWIIKACEHADVLDAARLLRTRGARPCGRRTSEKR